MIREHDNGVVDLLLSRAGNSPMVFGHRGYSALAPENTLAAFQKIKEHGIEGVELDIHQCATGEIVVIHDNDLGRLAGSPLCITDAPLHQLVEHDVGRWFSDEFAGEHVPTLEQVFELLGNSVLYDIEIKHHGVTLRGPQPGGVEERLAELIHRFAFQDRCLVSSFDPLAIHRFRRVEPRVPRAVIYVDSPETPRWLRYGHGGRIVGGVAILKPQFAQVTATMVAKHRQSGRPMVVWTVDEESDARDLAEAGVAGIVSNDPGKIVAALR